MFGIHENCPLKVGEERKSGRGREFYGRGGENIKDAEMILEQSGAETRLRTATKYCPSLAKAELRHCGSCGCWSPHAGPAESHPAR